MFSGANETGLVLVTAPDVYQPEVLSLVDELTEIYRRTERIDYSTGLTKPGTSSQCGYPCTTSRRRHR